MDICNIWPPLYFELLANGVQMENRREAVWTPEKKLNRKASKKQLAKTYSAPKQESKTFEILQIT